MPISEMKQVNISETISSSIIYEAVPVNCEIIIDENANYTIHPTGEVTLTLYAQNASEMLISNHKEFRRADWHTLRNQSKTGRSMKETA